MSIKLTKNAQLYTPYSALISGQTDATISMFLRYDGVPAAGAGNFNYLSPQYPYFQIYSEYSSPNVGLTSLFTLGAAQQYPSATQYFSTGTVYHVAVTITSGLQRLYVDGVPFLMGSYSGYQIEPGQVYGLAIGDNSASSGFGFSARDVAIWAGYSATLSEVQSLRDGADPATIGAGASARWHWTLAGTQGNAVQAGDPGLADAFGHSLPFNTLVPGSGTILYTDAMPFVPAATAAARVDTSGRAIYVVCSDLSGNWTPETQYVVEPTIAINGGAPFQLGQGALSVVRSQFNRGMLYILPSGMQIAPTDVVTISAPGGFANTAAGMVAAMTNQAVTNCVGRSYFGSDTAARTLKLGINYDDTGFGVTAENWVTKNLRPRAYLNFGVIGHDANGKPTKINVPVANTQVAWTNTDTNGLDQTGNTQPAGLWAVRWDTTNGTVLGLASSDGTCTERTDLANAGSGGVGLVRVFNIQPTSPLAGFQVQLTFSGGHDNGDGTYDLAFSNDAVLGPGDFTPGTPTVIPMPGEGEASASLAVRCPNGVGTVRWENSSLGYDMTNATDPEHFQPVSDWAYQGGKAYWRVGFTQARPFDPMVSPYVYSHLVGETYSCTLAVTQALDAPASGTIQNIHIADASAAVVLGGTGPIFPSQTLVNGSELIRVISIDVVDGTLVTVERGSVGTTPQSLAAGSTLTVRYRHAVPTALANINGWNTTGVDVVELVTSAARHNVRSGMNVIKSPSGWPTFTFTDGFTWSFNGDSHICWVTGPNTMLQILGPWDPNNAANCTLGTTYTLNPTNCYSDILIPDSSNVPFEIQAACAGQIAGANAWVNVPILATDAYVYKMAQTYLANFPAGRRIYIELQNEPWNLGYTHYQIFSLLNYYSGSFAHMPNDVWPWDVRRSGQVRKIWKDVFNAAGRGNEVFVGMNVQIGADDAVYATMNQAKAENLPIDFIANAPYWDMPTDTATWLPLMYTREMDLVCSLASYHLNTMWTPQAFDQGSIQSSYAPSPPALAQAYGRSDGNSGIKVMIDKWNAANASWNAANLSAGKVIFLGYEGGPDLMFQPLHDSVHNVGGMDNATTSLVVGTAARYFVGQYLLVDPYGSADNAQYWVFGPNSEWVKVTAIDTGTQTLTVLRGQSGTTARAHAAGVGVRSADIELGRDMVYHPNFRIVERDYYNTLQQCGYDNFNLYAYDKGYYNFIAQWGIYHGAAQLPGVGDGSDGKANNLACLAAPGPGQKSAATNQDAHNVSVRGRALLEWNQPAGTTPQTTPRRKFKYVPPPRYR
jgi:hypothetical protein